VITDASNPNVLVTFVADYHVRGQDVLLYEQPSAVAFPAVNARTVQIGAIEGQLFQDDTGTSALQWYQHGIICQITSKLPVERLVTLASTFQQIKSWDLILSRTAFFSGLSHPSGVRAARGVAPKKPCCFFV
jgi:hypothetical protein